VIALECRAVVELVSAYLDQELEADTHRRFTAHLAGCNGCEQYVDQFRQTVGLVGRLACRRGAVAPEIATSSLATAGPTMRATRGSQRPWGPTSAACRAR
jgi:anti-sigma factor RsiW